MRKFKAYFLSVALLPFAVMACMVCVNLAIDPYHIFTKGRDYPFVANGLRHYENAGIINNFAISNIIVGGSLMDNFAPSEVEAALGWQDVFQLTLNDADAASIAGVTQYALKKHAVKNVVFCLQPERLADIQSDREAKRGAAKNFIFLYDDKRYNDLLAFAQIPVHFIKAYYESKKQFEALKARFPGLDAEKIRAASKDLYANYMPEHSGEFNRPLFISSLVDPKATSPEISEVQKDNLAQNYAENIEPLVKNNPSTRFYFVVPPAAFFERREHSKVFAYALDFLVHRLAAYPNVKIFGFVNDPFNADLRLYKDLNHFHIEVARFVIQSLAHDDHRLTPESIGAYLREFNRLMAGYKVPEVWQAEYYPLRNGPYPKAGYITYHDAAKLVWGVGFSERLNNSIPRSPYLAESSYGGASQTLPPLNASRPMLLSPPAK